MDRDHDEQLNQVNPLPRVWLDPMPQPSSGLAMLIVLIESMWLVEHYSVSTMPCYRKSARIICAALWPGAPVTSPPGCVPAPQRYRLEMGVR